MSKEEEIKNEDVKAEFEKLEQGRAEATEESSTEEKEASESSTEDVKTGTEETAEETAKKSEAEPEPKVIPYGRFKEVNDRLKNFEELEKEVGALVERGPDGKLRLKQEAKEDIEEKVDDGLKLTEEEQLALDSVQTSVVSKLVQREFRLQRIQEEYNRVYRDESSKWWDKAKEEFPEASKKDSDFYKRADKIFREQYVKPLGRGQWTAPPNGHYLACLQAEKELSREKVKTTQAKIEENKTKKQQVFVEKKSGTAQPKKKADVKDFERASPSEQEELLREQFQESNPEE